MEIKAEVVQVLPEISGESAKGPWVKQEFIVEMMDSFKHKVCIEAWGRDDCNTVNELKPGKVVTVHFNIESTEYNGRWYTKLRAWKITVK